METATIISRRSVYNRRHKVQKQTDVGSHQPEEMSKQYAPMAMIPFLVLVYIINGSHDPKKMDWLNASAGFVFCCAGIFLNADFFFIGIMFFAIVLANIVCVWVVQNFHWNVRSAALGEIVSQLHVSVCYYSKR